MKSKQFLYQGKDKMESQRGENNKDVHWIDISDVHVFQQQYNRYFTQLKYFGMRYLTDEEVVSDLIQDLWLKIWERKENLINETTFKNYLFQGLYRNIIDYFKHDNVVKEYIRRENSEGMIIEREISYKIIEAEIYQIVNLIFEELPDSSRRVYAACLNGKSYKEISEDFSISINTVKKHINNANHYMRKRIKDFLLFILSFR